MSINTRKAIIVSIICIVIAAGIFALVFSMFGCGSNPVVSREEGFFYGTVYGIGMDVDGDDVKTYAITYVDGVIVPVELDAEYVKSVGYGIKILKGTGTLSFDGEKITYKDGTVKYTVKKIIRTPG